MKLTIFVIIIIAVISTAADAGVQSSSESGDRAKRGASRDLGLLAFMKFMGIITVPPADVRLDYISFFDVGCGVPRSSWTRNRGKRDVTLNKLKMWHSMVNFRGKWYEWGSGFWVYQDGGIGRRGTCKGLPYHKGKSSCTREQADRLGQWYINNNDYNLFANNCHYFSEWLVNRLLNNRCEI